MVPSFVKGFAADKRNGPDGYLGQCMRIWRLVAWAGVLGFAAVAVVSDVAAQAKKPLRVVTTFTVIQDIAQNVAGSAAIVESITRPGAEIHDYQPTPLDVVKAQSADLVLWNGMNLERWFERFFDNVKEVPSVVVTEGITPLGITEGPYTGKPNPHAWMSPSNGVDLRREHPQGARQARPRQRRDLRQERRRVRRQDQGARRAAAQAAGGDPRGPALARHQRGRVQLSGARLQSARALPVADQCRRAWARPSRCGA